MTHAPQATPTFDAKGIETVRRDGCPAERKVLERALRLLFSAQPDLSALKAYVLQQCDKIRSGRIVLQVMMPPPRPLDPSRLMLPAPLTVVPPPHPPIPPHTPPLLLLQDFVIASEVRGASGSAYAGTPPPHAQVAAQRAREDPSDVAEAGERVAYVVAHTRSGPAAMTKLMESARRPELLLFGSNTLELNAEHYINKRVLPPLNRVLTLLGLDVFAWYKWNTKRTRRAPLDREVMMPPPPHHPPTSPHLTSHQASTHPLPRREACGAAHHVVTPPSTPCPAQVSEHGGRGTMLQHLNSAHCVLCDGLCNDTQTMCATCAADPVRAGCALQLRLRSAQQQLDAAERHCTRCARVHERAVALECRSIDCSHMYARLKLTRQLRAAEKHAEALDHLDF